MFYKLCKPVSVLLCLVFLMTCSPALAAAEETVSTVPAPSIDWSILEEEVSKAEFIAATTGNPVPAGFSTSGGLLNERYQEILEEGGGLEYLYVEKEVVFPENERVQIGTRGVALGYRVVRVGPSTQTKTKTRYLNSMLNGVTNFSSVIDTLVSLVPYVGWIPSAVGINTNTVASWISGRNNYTESATFDYYDIQVNIQGVGYYTMASTERTTCNETVVTIASGQPHKTCVGSATYQTATYGNESVLSTIAIQRVQNNGDPYIEVIPWGSKRINVHPA